MPSTVSELVKTINENASLFEKFFQDRGLPEPSLSVDCFPEPVLPVDVALARDKLIAASEELSAIARGPTDVARETATQMSVFAGFQALSRFQIPSYIPLDGDISYEDLANKCGLRPNETKRIVRFAMTCNVFTESRPGFVTHNGPSRAMVEAPMLREWIAMVYEELWPASIKGYQLGHNTSESVFKFMMHDPDRATRFSNAMSASGKAPGMEPERLVDAYPWSELAESPVFVDVGGSHGTVSLAIAKGVPNINCVVQDLPNVVSNMKPPKDVGERVRFMEHDFFTEQPVKNADVYFFRWVFHDWSDSYCVKILRSLIPALKVGARVMVNEFCLQPPGRIPAHLDRKLRGYDLVMLGLQNAKERDADDWKAVFSQADVRFRFKSMRLPKGSKLALIEFEWR